MALLSPACRSVLGLVLRQEGIDIAVLHTATRYVGAPVIAEQLAPGALRQVLDAQRRTKASTAFSGVGMLPAP
jgi:hypothetical protein